MLWPPLTEKMICLESPERSSSRAIVLILAAEDLEVVAVIKLVFVVIRYRGHPG
jgi:hypothetical protein